LGCKAEDCLYVDDREGNLEAAIKVGMSAVLFNRRNVQYEGNAVTDFIQLTNMLL
jgi:putative hydrolase of the HAD superfamily